MENNTYEDFLKTQICSNDFIRECKSWLVIVTILLSHRQLIIDTYDLFAVQYAFKYTFFENFVKIA